MNKDKVNFYVGVKSKMRFLDSLLWVGKENKLIFLYNKRIFLDCRREPFYWRILKNKFY